MSSTIMVGNGTGWQSIGTCTHENVGHAADSVGIVLETGETIAFEVGTQVLAYTKSDKREINRALNKSRWIAHTMADCRVSPGGAVIEIERNFYDQDGRKVVALFERTI